MVFPEKSEARVAGCAARTVEMRLYLDVEQGFCKILNETTSMDQLFGIR